KANPVAMIMISPISLNRVVVMGSVYRQKPGSVHQKGAQIDKTSELAYTTIISIKRLPQKNRQSKNKDNTKMTASGFFTIWYRHVLPLALVFRLVTLTAAPSLAIAADYMVPATDSGVVTASTLRGDDFLAATNQVRTA